MPVVAIGSALRVLRAVHDVSQDDVAKASGLNRVTIAQYERGVRKPSREHVARIVEGIVGAVNSQVAA